MIGETNQVRVIDDNNTDDSKSTQTHTWLYEDCRVIAVECSRTQQIATPLLQSWYMIVYREFEDGEIWYKIELGDIQQTVRKKNEARPLHS